MTDTLARQFLELHHQPEPLLIPNPWDVGSARVLASLGFRALATTSAGFAGTLGRLDGGVTRDEALEHARVLSAATSLPVSADLENGFGDTPDDVAETVRRAAQTGLSGCSIEDYTGRTDDPFYDRALATERISAAADAAHGGAVRLVLTGRAENYLRGNRDLTDTIERLQAYQEAGADVLFAPGVTELDELRTLVAAVDRPVNALPFPGSPPVAALAEIGVKRISIGSAFFAVGVAALATAATELLEQGTYGFWSQVPAGMTVARAAFTA